MVETIASEAALKLLAYGATHIGQVRIHNEDSVLLREDLSLFILADGAGGHNAGNVASALATTSTANYFEATQHAHAGKPDIDDYGLSLGARRLAVAMQRAHHDIVEIAKTANRYRGMGTTVVAIFAQPETGTIHVGHVGDSRCYRMRGGVLEQLTHDHSLLNDVLELRPDIDDIAISKLPRHVVTRALGMAERIRVSVRSYQMLPFDRYLLCSDGLTDTLDDEGLGIMLVQQRAPEDVVRILIDQANLMGGPDNIAAVVIDCQRREGAPATRKPLASRPHFTVEMRGQMDSAPEIIIVGTENVEENEIHVVPRETATSGLLEAFAGLAGTRHRKDGI